jgi:hypothetical protein
MGNSEEYQESQQEQNNIYIPNLLAKKIVGDNESRKNDSPMNSFDNKNEINKGTYINEKKIGNQKMNELSSEKNKYKYLNINKEFDYLNNDDNNDNDIITKGKALSYNNNIFINHNPEAIKMEITNQKKDLGYKKYKFNGITVVQNLKDYLPKDISKEEIKEMIYNAFGEGLVDDAKYFIPGKTVTRKQANAIVDLVANFIKNDSIVKNLNKDFLNGVNIIIDLVDLNKNIIKEKMFKGKNPSDRELENIFKNLSQGYTNVKILSIEFQ